MRPTCNATRLNGQPCAAKAVTDSDKCSFHKSDEHPGAEPTKLTPETTDKLVALIRAGNYVAVACRAVGISRALFYQWLDRGVSEDPADVEYRELREQVELARAEGEARNVAAIASAARESWQAAAWLLERMYPERWGRVSVRMRDDAATAQASDEQQQALDDVFAEVDELAAARRKRIA